MAYDEETNLPDLEMALLTLHCDYLLNHKGQVLEIARTVSWNHFTKTSKVACSHWGKLGHRGMNVDSRPTMKS
jgi:hypothetical protein